jgi:hypothetical protein
MGGSRKPDQINPQSSAPPPMTPGTWGLNDQGDPNVCTLQGDTPGSVGVNDYAAPSECYGDPTYDEAEQVTYAAVPPPGDDDWQSVASGNVPVGVGIGSVVRIPVPGSRGLFVEFSPRGRVPAGGSTSTLFIQDATGKRHLRLDYGFNKTNGSVDYHWNQKGTHAQFGITDHTSTGDGGKALYKGARYFKYAGRVLLVVGAALDIYSIVVAKKKMRQVAKVVGGWAGAAGGCKLVGAFGAGLGSAEPGGGTAAGAVAGCIIGGIGGYAGASWVVGEAYDWVEETFFEPVPEIAAP